MKKNLMLNINILGKVTSLGTFKNFQVQFVLSLQFYKEEEKEKNRSMHIASSGEGINEITRILAKNGSWQQPSRNCIFAFATLVSTFVFPLLQLCYNHWKNQKKKEPTQNNCFLINKRKLCQTHFCHFLFEQYSAIAVKKQAMVSIIFYFRFFL